MQFSTKMVVAIPVILAAIGITIALMRTPSASKKPISFIHTNLVPGPADPNAPNLYLYIQSLASSHTPESVALRAKCAAAPADLARERKLAELDGLLGVARKQEPPNQPNANALLDEWDSAQKAQVKLPDYAESMDARYQYTPEQFAAVRAVINHNARVFNTLHRAADMKSREYQKSYAGIGDIHIIGHELGTIRAAARQLRMESFILAKEGNYKEAIADSARQMNLVKQIDGPVGLDVYLMNASFAAIGLRSFRNVLFLSGANADVASKVQAALGSAQPALSLSGALASDANSNIKSLDYIRTTKNKFVESNILYFSSNAVPNRHLTTAELILARQIVAGAEAYYLHNMRTTFDSERRSTTANVAATSAESANWTAESGLSDPFQFVANSFIGVVQLILATKIRFLAEEEVVLAAAEALKTMSLTGSLPAALPSKFVDPVTHKPLKYTVNGNGGFTVSGTEPRLRASDPPTRVELLSFNYPVIPVPLPTARE